MSNRMRGLKAVAVNLKWWQVGLIAVGVSFLGSLTGGRRDEAELYARELEQAPWAPPAWVFAPAWTINNFFLLMGLQRLLKRSDVPEHRRLAVLQACIWVIFFSFNYVYFRKRSTVLAAVWTLADTAFAIAGFRQALRADRKVAYTYLPLVGWTSFASTLAVYQALKNKDEALGTPALLG